MRRTVLMLFCLALMIGGYSLHAVQPAVWRVNGSDEFLEGEIDGFAIASRGGLIPSPAISKLASFSDPFVLSQTMDDQGESFFGTGNDGNVYRLRKGGLELLTKLEEPEIYAMAWHDGSVYAASSPYGKVYRIDPGSGDARVWFDPDDAYIWSLQFASDGSLLAATGLPGKLYRIDRNGKSEALFDAPESHLRSLAIRPDGVIIVGGSGEGRIYEVRGKNKARALFDSDLTEISALVSDPATGVVWAAAVTNALPTTPPAQPTPPANAAGATAEQQGGAQPQGNAAVDFTFSFDSSLPATPSPGSSELYRIDRDGFTEQVWKFDREMIYAVGVDGPDGVYLSTGPQGRIYLFKERELSLVATVPEKQLVSFVRRGDVSTVTTTNSGAVYRLDGKTSKSASYRSKVKDTGGFSTFGHYSVDGSGLEERKISVSFRTGNSATPDATWSDWVLTTGPSGQIGAPSARYLQWRVEVSSPPPGFRIDSFSTAWVNRNLPPVIESLTVNEPGVIFITTSYPSPPQILEATNPDELGMFTSLDTPSSPRNDPGKRYYRKGYRSFTWRGRDPNGDSLKYDLSFRRVGESQWLRFRDKLTDLQFNFDTSQLPDGEYEIRLVASDEESNPGQGLEDVKEGVRFVVDNTSPRISSSPSSDGTVIRIEDSESIITRLEYSVDAERWIPLVPMDGLADSRLEQARLSRDEINGRFVMVRAVDAHFNAVTALIPSR